VKPRKLLFRIAGAQTGVKFSDLLRLVSALGFTRVRASGSHQIFEHTSIPDARLNLQPDGNEAKPYQVRQLLKLIEEYDLRIESEDE
jgi:predicted RNA binding protein YcfA (HicA-like mRNA interferase family)